jgi:hypothetical protein
MSPPLREKTFIATSSGPKKIMNLNCSFLLPPIRTWESLT